MFVVRFWVMISDLGIEKHFLSSSRVNSSFIETALMQRLDPRLQVSITLRPTFVLSLYVFRASVTSLSTHSGCLGVISEVANRNISISFRSFISQTSG